MARKAGSLGLVLVFGAAGPALAAPPEVVVSIKPLHSLVASVMGDLGEPTLLVKGAASPHSYSLRPSEAKALSQADLVFWVGEGMETFMVGPLEALSSKAQTVEISTLKGIELLDAREGGAWEAHDHGDHGHDDHGHSEEAQAGHDHDDHGHDDHGHAEEAKAGHDHDDHGHDDHGHAEHAEAGHDLHHKNLHLWLDPGNAKVVVEASVRMLSELDPENAEGYEVNGAKTLAELTALDGELSQALSSVKGRPYVVFHDAYPYFEGHYGLAAVGSISVGDGRAPSAKRLREVREKIVDSGALCVFSEPQFQPALVETVIEGTAARSGTLDPLGANLEAGPPAYGQIMRGLASSLAKCLAPQS